MQIVLGQLGHPGALVPYLAAIAREHKLGQKIKIAPKLKTQKLAFAWLTNVLVIANGHFGPLGPPVPLHAERDKDLDPDKSQQNQPMEEQLAKTKTKMKANPVRVTLVLSMANGANGQDGRIVTRHVVKVSNPERGFVTVPSLKTEDSNVKAKIERKQNARR